MTVPPYIVACFCCITGGFAADRLKTRGVFMIGFNCVALIGLIMHISSQNPHVKYTGCFLFAAGLYPNVPQGVAWNGNNIGGSVKRGVGIAMHVGFGKTPSFFRHHVASLHLLSFALLRLTSPASHHLNPITSLR
jgi:hypothetical protein